MAVGGGIDAMVEKNGSNLEPITLGMAAKILMMSNRTLMLLFYAEDLTRSTTMTVTVSSDERSCHDLMHAGLTFEVGALTRRQPL